MSSYRFCRTDDILVWVAARRDLRGHRLRSEPGVDKILFGTAPGPRQPIKAGAPASICTFAQVGTTAVRSALNFFSDAGAAAPPMPLGSERMVA